MTTKSKAKPVKRPVGRPRKKPAATPAPEPTAVAQPKRERALSERKFNRIIRRVEQGWALAQAFTRVGVAPATFYRAVEANAEWRDTYARACARGEDSVLDATVVIADAATADSVQVDRLRVDARIRSTQARIARRAQAAQLSTQININQQQPEEPPMSSFELARMILFGLRLAVEEQNDKAVQDLPLLSAPVAAEPKPEPPVVEPAPEPRVEPEPKPYVPDPLEWLRESQRIERRDRREAARDRQFAPSLSARRWRRG